ncbi:biotin--[acetyl-CoA-carboxylase] ligase [Thermodesulfobacterium sp. TA1]|uniref:biotin--[acetyl-CoA-carboxylase] ligase n=1 Tax=Thermodesulfobacterium sp. TA1 TaxID=2234087 RepID=UPI001232AECA|nr:biotin--[acetyl-CoA-carboxylase] ligase [Thermodesulfobacterium sp. TA1]QER42620.1 biotin--[acetyl-CoA-carboxylase] ligase [Thermodesulfobacterium sp. TA1]
MRNYNLKKFKILELLSQSSFISGEILAQKLEISRTAVWKYIQALKAEGYPIVTTKKGYTLKPTSDLILPEKIEQALKKQKIGLVDKVYYFRSVSSTMEVAKELAKKEKNFLVIAEIQTSGRGRLGRSWLSNEGGIWMSLLIRPSFSLRESFILTYLASLCVVKALRETTQLPFYLKWPNDVVFLKNEEIKKVAGILLELKAEVDQIEYAIIGIGINVNNQISPLEPTGISLQELTNKIWNRTEIIIEIIENFEKYSQTTSEEILKAWKELCLTLGKKVKIIKPQEELIGIAIDIAEDGALILETGAPSLVKIYSGDCIHLRTT